MQYRAPRASLWCWQSEAERIGKRLTRRGLLKCAVRTLSSSTRSSVSKQQRIKYPHKLGKGEGVRLGARELGKYRLECRSTEYVAS